MHFSAFKDPKDERDVVYVECECNLVLLFIVVFAATYMGDKRPSRLQTDFVIEAVQSQKPGSLI
jgi:hypothetical protein